MANLTSSVAVRSHLQQALQADLIGPFAGDEFPEILDVPPTRWYLTGFLVPEGRPIPDDSADAEASGEETEVIDKHDEQQPESSHDPAYKQRGRLPASIGLSVFLPAGTSQEYFTAIVSYADYRAMETGKEEQPKQSEENNNNSSIKESTSNSRKQIHWERLARAPITIPIPLDTEVLKNGIPIPHSEGLVLIGQLSFVPSGTAGLTADARALALFLVNRRQHSSGPKADEQVIFQVSLTVSFVSGLLGRQNIRDEEARDWDERLADLQFRDRLEYAVGHGIAVEVDKNSQGQVIRARTCWIPAVTVPLVRTRSAGKTTVSMEALANLSDGLAVRSALGTLVTDYSQWIAQQQQRIIDSPRRQLVRTEVMAKAVAACQRIEAGITLLEQDPQVRVAFCLANKAMAMTARQRDSQTEPCWRLFQLAFLLLNLKGISDPEHPDRECVELIFFPTGGGKTEAYLGVIAFLLVLRRLRGKQRPDQGLGVAVLLRYTLRLLTLDQLGRAAGLICALELLRRQDPQQLGAIRFSIGLWVGKSATANRLKEVAEQITEYRNNNSSNASPPCPLTHCPWCNHQFTADSFEMYPKKSPRAVMVGCSDFQCPFCPGNNPAGLPLVFVDEQIYNELPSFIIATVDKFAMLPWRGETGLLFGRASAMVNGVMDSGQFLGPEETIPRQVTLLPQGLVPPELIIQDELHLISGPLGTMVGLYEVAIETLASRPVSPEAHQKLLKPKIIASTATVRRAFEQVRGLFARSTLAVFPPSGVDDSETFFAEVEKEGAGRLYVGVAAPGRAMKAVLLRTYIALLGAAQHAYQKLGFEDAADGYMTLAGYFNSLRELGGMRRLVEDEIRARTAKLGNKKPVNQQKSSPWFANRNIALEPVELTSREKTTAVASIKSRLKKKHQHPDHVDVLLASNMISVGIDIDRLGLMVVAGQPKSTSEYIQASSRVGRKKEWPGLVVTVFNPNRPRDRSHYERFTTYHQSFYRFVEASSVTPFSGPALERALAAVLVAMTRLSNPVMTPPPAVMRIDEFWPLAEEALQQIAQRAQFVTGGVGAQLRKDAVLSQGQAILSAWSAIVNECRQAAAQRCYSSFESATGKSLLQNSLSPESSDSPDQTTSADERKFAAPTSMRDVERVVSIWVKRKIGKGPSHGG